MKFLVLMEYKVITYYIYYLQGPVFKVLLHFETTDRRYYQMWEEKSI